MFNPFKAILDRFGYRKFERVEKFDRDTMRRIGQGQPREMWDDIALASSPKPPKG